MLNVIMWLGGALIFAGLVMVVTPNPLTGSGKGVAVLMTGVMAFLGSLLFSMFIAERAETEMVVLERTPLAALGNSTQLEGEVRGGYLSVRVDIEENRVYDYVRKNENGSYSIGTIDAEGVEVYQDTSADDANITIKQCKYTDNGVKLWMGTACGPAITEVHVPEGSIVQDFKIAVGE